MAYQEQPPAYDEKAPVNDGKAPIYDEKATSRSHAAPQVHQAANVSIPAFDVHLPAFSRAYVLKDPSNGRDLIFAKTSSFTPGKPDLTFYAGGAEAGPMVASCKTHHWSGDEMALGDAAHPQASERLRDDTSFTHGRFDFEADVAGARRAFAWERTRAPEDGVHGFKRLLSLNFVLRDLQLNQDVAVYLIRGHKSWGKHGELRFKVPVPKELEMWSVVSLLTILLKARRRQNAQAGAAGGGGGGGGSC